MGTLNFKKEKKYNIIKYSGELTLDVVEELKEEISKFINECDNEKSLVFDLSDISFMDSSGIGFLVHLNNVNKTKNKKLYLLNPSGAVKKTLSLVNLLNFFEIIEDESELDIEIENI
ncbi:hypothetical protein JCM12298_05690 [Desulfothermus naphthae]